MAFGVRRSALFCRNSSSTFVTLAAFCSSFFASFCNEPRELPIAVVRTAVHVQHLPCDLTSFRQVTDSAGNILNGGDAFRALQKILNSSERASAGPRTPRTTLAPFFLVGLFSARRIILANDTLIFRRACLLLGL